MVGQISFGIYYKSADLNGGSYFLKVTETGEYPRIPTKLLLLGQDKDGNWDLDGNSFYSNVVHSDVYGYATLTALLPGVWGNDGYFDSSMLHRQDYNEVYFRFLRYIAGQGFGYVFELDEMIYVTFSPFINVGAH